MTRGPRFGRLGPVVLGVLGAVSVGAGLLAGREGLVVIGVVALAGAAVAGGTGKLGRRADGGEEGGPDGPER
ncbi:hypothetical protein Tbon_01340 [Tepidiforma bonchosmolovskayae]|uniref:Uncharacterized protein n=1 Tax=Tepidiforma bonchosmolovskayae TaxID=2601677 RepID=A0ABX6BYZ8_9CHLR|nr:hypothetical protein Tbon_01340 [Tepidiforma bonchosmolovskayae]